MRKWSIGACALVVLGCRAEERDQALGSERPTAEKSAEERPGAQPTPARPGELAAPPNKLAEPKPPADLRPGAAVDDEKASTERLLCKALQLNEKEVETSKLAKERSSSPAVKAFAAKMVSDHQQDIDAIHKLAAEKRLNVEPMSDDPLARAGAAAHKQRMEDLRSLRGVAFDFAYMGPQADKHIMLAKIADEARKVSSDPEVDGLFTKLAGQAHDHRAEIAGALPQACGGTAAPGPAHGSHGGHEREQPGTPKP